MIQEKDLLHAWVYTSTKESAHKTGVAAVVILCFKDTPKESRVALWYTKATGGEYRFMVPEYPVTIAAGPKNIPCIFGSVVNEQLIAWAERAREKLKADLKAKNIPLGAGKVYKVSKESSEETHR